jgi:hypothetical protein
MLGRLFNKSCESDIGQGECCLGLFCVDKHSCFAQMQVAGQQPGGETPGVAAAPVALAGAIMPGLARSMVMLSLQAAEFGVGMAAEVGSMLVSPSAATTG